MLTGINPMDNFGRGRRECALNYFFIIVTYNKRNKLSCLTKANLGLQPTKLGDAVCEWRCTVTLFKGRIWKLRIAYQPGTDGGNATKAKK